MVTVELSRKKLHFFNPFLIPIALDGVPKPKLINENALVFKKVNYLFGTRVNT
jgi:hypothetical protein